MQSVAKIYTIRINSSDEIRSLYSWVYDKYIDSHESKTKFENTGKSYLLSDYARILAGDIVHNA